MKRVLSLHLTMMALCIIAILASCNGYESPLKGAKVGDLEFGFHNSRQVFHLGDMSNCKVETSEEWCHAYISGDSLVVAVDDNKDYDNRTAQVTATDDEDGTRLTFNVKQRQCDAIFSDYATFDVEEEGGDVTIKVWSNINYTVDLNGTDWISIDQSTTRGLEESAIHLIVARNQSGDQREAIVGITYPETGLTHEVTIRQFFNAFVVLDRDYINVDKAGGEVAFTVKANVPFNVESAYSWVKAGTQTETAPNTYSQTIPVEPLPEGYANRRCVIYVASANGKIYNMLTISQSE